MYGHIRKCKLEGNQNKTNIAIQNSGFDQSEKNKSGEKKICEICNETVLDPLSSKSHIMECFYVSKYIKETQNGVQCLNCAFETSKLTHPLKYRKYMHDHILSKACHTGSKFSENRSYEEKNSDLDEIELNFDTQARKMKKCESCDILISNHGANYARHMELCRLYSEFVTEVENGFQCAICEKIARKRNNMYDHVKRCKEQNKTMFENEINSKKKTNIKKITKIPNNEGNFMEEILKTVCPFCNEVFSNENFARHVTACKIYSKYSA